MTDSLNDEGKKKITNTRATFYKKPIKKDNYRLEVEEDTPQEIRRQALLLRQKKRREDHFNNARGLLEEVLSNYQDDADDEEEEIDKEIPNKNTRLQKYRKNNLMLSEWMLEVPEDFVDKWTMVPCPVGRRMLLVATKGITKAYNKQGRRISQFYSALPGGNHKDYYHKFTLMDCIYEPDEKVYYALDVLAWSNQGFIDCDTNFRFYWVKSKLSETDEYRIKSAGNTFPIIPLPTAHCNTNLSEFLANLTDFPKLDGVLFFHRDAHYNIGRTPLVTWLKPYMLSEVLGIFVPEEYDVKPEGYIDAQHFFATKGRRKRIFLENAMEYELDDQSTNDTKDQMECLNETEEIF